jgi:hypothetical protein
VYTIQYVSNDGQWITESNSQNFHQDSAIYTTIHREWIRSDVHLLVWMIFTFKVGEITKTRDNAAFTLGLPSEFPSQKISRNRLGTAFLIPRKKVLLSQNGSDWSYLVPSVFLFYEMVLNEIWSPFRETEGIPTEWIKISVCSVFRGIIFFSENGNPTLLSIRASLGANSTSLLLFQHGDLNNIKTFAEHWNK